MRVNADELWLFLLACFFLIYARLFLCFFPIDHYVEKQPFQDKEAEASREAALKGCSSAIRRAARHLPWKNSCLVCSLALCMMARRVAGVDLRISFGVNSKLKGADDFAHAWVEYGGKVILDTGDKFSFIIMS